MGILYLLRCLFYDVSVCKPIMSTPGNSETYIVARYIIQFSTLKQVVAQCDYLF